MSLKLQFHTPIQYLKGVGPSRKILFERMGIFFAADLLYYLPRRYEDRSHMSKIKCLTPSKIVTVKAKVVKKNLRRIYKRSMVIFEAIVKDETATIKCIWFNQPYLDNIFEPGQNVIIHGKVEVFREALQFSNPEYEMIAEEDDSLNTGRIVPVYSLPERFSQKQIRILVDRVIQELVPSLKDSLGYPIRKKYDLINLAQALSQIHFPQSLESVYQCYKRLSFDEFFIFQLIIGLKKIKHKGKKGIAHETQAIAIKKFVKQLPFKFTISQQLTIAEILKDMSSQKAMRRLLQGDVGSGKTVVAIYAAVIALQNNHKCAFMVPTEILAEQHYSILKKLLKNLKFKILLLTSSTPKTEKTEIYDLLKSDEAIIIVGTHALIQNEANFKDLSLVIIDEQHKFGVLQQQLMVKKGENPDLLVMTATPIPRSLALTLYGDLDISTIDEMPAGRGKINTIHARENERGKIYAFLKEKIDQGRQVFIVYPLIEESSKMDLKAASTMFEELQARDFREYSLGLIHGRMKPQERKKIMDGFKSGKIQILISTVVIEVGLDIPNATCLIIEHGERFGLSQLHQMRGRIGRGDQESFCIIFSKNPSEIAKKRIDVFSKTQDGFKISEKDLALRGPGEFFGQRQHGDWEFRVANPVRDIELLNQAREEAFCLLQEDPRLQKKENELIKNNLIVKVSSAKNLLVSL